MIPDVPESTSAHTCSRRAVLQQGAAGLLTAGGLTAMPDASQAAEPAADPQFQPRPWIKIRGIYGGFPTAFFERGESPVDYGVNAVWVGSGGLKQDEIRRCHQLGLKVYAEFNSMHDASYLKDHPDAAPLGPDGQPSPPPFGWQGVSPFHAGYRQNRMQEFRRVLETYEIDGIWLDYHHAHASWERDEPALPDTDFSPAALQQFTQKTGVQLPADIPAAARLLLGPLRDGWTQFRCDVFTDWVREYREILNAVRPDALLGTFHCPWSPEDYDGAIRHKLAIDLPAQAPYLDVFSIMPYHARFGHPQNPAWIARQTRSLGTLLNLTGAPGEKQQIWPIVQLADWGPMVSAEQVPQIIDYGTQLPATGVMVFHWSGVSQQWDKVNAMGRAYRAIQPAGQ
jgi:hypothetical protein